MENKPLVPTLRFPEFRDAPEWEERLLGQEGQFLGSLNGKSAQDFGSGGSEYITYMNVFSNMFADLATLGKVQVDPAESQNAVRQGDVLFTVSSETPDEAGMSSVVLDPVSNCYLNSFCTLFRFYEQKRPDMRFVAYLLRQQRTRRSLITQAQGVTRFNLSRDAFRKLPLAFPKPAEQKKIAECLSSLDELIAAERRKLEALRAYKKGLMQNLFPREGETVPRLRFSEFRDAGEWELKPLRDITEHLTEKVGDRQLIPVSISAGTGFVSQYEKFGRDISGAQYRNYVHLRQGDFSYNKGNSKRYPQGCVYELRQFEEAAVPSAFVSFHFRSDYVNGFFQPQFEKNSHGQELRKFITSGARGDGLLNVSPDEFFGIKLPVPRDIAEQQKIADCLTSLEALITAQANRLDSLKVHKNGLMQGLFPMVGDL